MNSSDLFAAIVKQHYQPLYRFALSLTQAEPDASDLTQETYYTWARQGHQLRDLAKVRAWLFTTLHRVFLSARRRQNRYPHIDLEQAGDQLPSVTEERFSAEDGSQAVTALGQVDEIYRPVLELFYLEDFSYKQIAAVLGIPVGTVKSRLVRGVAQLREILLSDGLRAATPMAVDTHANDGPLVPVSGGNLCALFTSHLHHSHV